MGLFNRKKKTQEIKDDFNYEEINITKILAWVGGILSTILTIKEIFY